MTEVLDEHNQETIPERDYEAEQIALYAERETVHAELAAVKPDPWAPPSGDGPTFAKPSEITAPKRDAGGDNEVERDNKGRPYIMVPCDSEPACDEGRIPSEKRPGNTVQCPRCKGKARRRLAYTRVTTFIDCIEDKSNLMAWEGRMVLVGAAKDPSYLDNVLDQVDLLAGDKDEQKQARDWLNRRAQSAKTTAGASIKAEKGTELHGLSELVDQGIELPDHSSFGDIIDMDAYKTVTTPLLNIVHTERLVVLDEFKVAGTPDRVSTIRDGVTLVAPDGHVFSPEELIITDLKTGSVEYGALKMAMQLSIYSRAVLYKDGQRTSMGNVNRNWGIIIHVAAGSGECDLYWADLSMGWRAVAIAREIRQLRTEGERALIGFVPEGV